MSICAYCLLFFSLALLRRKFNHHHSLHQIYTQWWDLLLFSPGWTVSSSSASSCVTNAPVPSLSMWPCAGLAIASPYLSCSWELVTAPSTPDLPYQSWADGRDHLIWPAGNVLPKAGTLSRWRILKRCWLGKFSHKYIQSEEEVESSQMTSLLSI